MASDHPAYRFPEGLMVICDPLAKGKGIQLTTQATSFYTKNFETADGNQRIAGGMTVFVYQHGIVRIAVHLSLSLHPSQNP